MGILRIGAQVMNPFMFLIKTCVRSIIYHSFFVCSLILLFLMNKSFPFLFSFFLYASPIFVSTAILLSTLLSFGQLTLREIENDNETRLNSGFVSLKTGISINVPSVGEKYCVKEYTNGKEKEVVGRGDGNSLDFEPLIDEASGEVILPKPASEFEIKRDRNWIVLEDYCSKTGNESTTADTKTYRPLVESVDDRLSEKIESSRENRVIDESSDEESDGDESVSLNPPLDGVIPLIDELDPLLDENAEEQPNQKLQQSSNYGTDESDNDDTSEEAEFGDAGTDGESEDREKSEKEVITWSEDDRKNVANLGTIELERNERLESVIARRRWQRLMAEKNLIDFDSIDVTTNNDVSPILTTRKNPFDFSQIPGSAPSLVQQRRNPFDLPFFTNEDRSEPMITVSHQGSTSFSLKDMSFRRHESFSVGPAFLGGSLLDDFSSFPPKEVSFRRHESFNMGPSIFGSKLKPYFVPERVGFEGTNYSLLERHLSEISESMASSVPETDSASSDGDKEENIDYSHDPKMMDDLDHVCEHVDHGSESSENVDEENQVDDKIRDVEGNAEFVSVASEDDAASSSSSEIQVEILEEDEDDDVASEISAVNSMSELHKEPVYDTSPRGMHKDLSFSSVSSEVQVEFSEMGDTPVLVKRTSFVNKELNLNNENITIDTRVNGKNDSSENKSLARESLVEVIDLQVNADQNQSSSVDENLQVSAEKKVIEELSPTHAQEIIKDISTSELEEQLPSSGKSIVQSSSKIHEELQEEPSNIKTEAVVEATNSDDHKQDNIQEIRNPVNDEEIKTNSNLNIEEECNPTENSSDGVSMSDHGKDKKMKKNKKSNKGSSSSSSSSSNDSD